MTQQLYTWEYKGDYWIGYKRDDGSLGGISKQGWQGIVCSQVTDLHKVKVVNESAIVIEEVLSCMSYQVNSDGTKFKYKIEGFAVDWEPSPKVQEPGKTLLTEDEREKVWRFLLPVQQLLIRRNVGGFTYGWVDAWKKQDISPYAEDWQEVLNPPVTEPTGFGAIVEAETKFYQDETLEWQLTITKSRDKWMNKYQSFACWSDLINPVVISEGVSDGLR